MRCLILNRNGEESLYQRGLHEVLACKGDKIILGYGYLEEEIVENSQFIKKLKVGFDGAKKKQIVLIGAKKNDYSQHIKASKILRKQIPDAEIQLFIKKPNPQYRQYHKKVAIKLIEDDPIMALIGSSNLTAPAYEDKKQYSNQEVDILLWNSFVIDEAGEKKLLGNLDKYIFTGGSEIFEILRNIDTFVKSLKIDVQVNLQLRLQLQDIIDEISHYQNNKFELKYISQNSTICISKNQMKGIIDSTNDLEVVKETLLYLYSYAQENLRKHENKSYFLDHYDYYVDLIDNKNKGQILKELPTCDLNIRRTLKYNIIEGETQNLYQKLEYILS